MQLNFDYFLNHFTRPACRLPSSWSGETTYENMLTEKNEKGMLPIQACAPSQQEDTDDSSHNTG